MKKFELTYHDPNYHLSDDDLIDLGFIPKGDVAEVIGYNGYPYQQENMKKLGIKIGDRFTVKRAMIGNSSSTYEFEEIDGEFNSVSFASILPLFKQ